MVAKCEFQISAMSFEEFQDFFVVSSTKALTEYISKVSL